jgi:hypothetical protein
MKGSQMTTDPFVVSTEALEELKDALTRAGITLPSLTIDLASCTRPHYPRPLLALGGCNLETARRLSAVLRAGAVGAAGAAGAER